MDQNTTSPQADNTQDTQYITEMQQKIASTLGIEGLPDEKQKNLIDKAVETLLQKIFLDTVENLSDDDKKTYLEMLDKEPAPVPEEIDKFLTEKIPGRKDNVQKLVNDFMSEMKEASTGGQKTEDTDNVPPPAPVQS